MKNLFKVQVFYDTKKYGDKPGFQVESLKKEDETKQENDL